MEKEKTLQERINECVADLDAALKKHGLLIRYSVFIPPSPGNDKPSFLARMCLKLLARLGGRVVADLIEAPKEQK